MVDLQSLQFLRVHGFDFNAFLERAHPYSRLPPLGHKLAGNAHAKATPVLQALRDAKVPLVLHNGLLDMLHVYDKFIGDLPQDREAFGKAWVEHFPMLFDTRVLAQDGRFHVLQHAGGFSLVALVADDPRIAALRVPSVSALAVFGLRSPSTVAIDFTVRAIGIPLLLLKLPRPLLSLEGGWAHTNFLSEEERCTTFAKAAHSAGYDAMVTAEVFLMEMDRWIRHVNSNAMPENENACEPASNGRKRKRSADAVEGLSSPSQLESHEACRRFHNRVALVNTSPGSMDLVPKEAEPLLEGKEKEGGFSEFSSSFRV
ncbi:Toe1 [Symbiodinium natans]|uniref:Toe1 protein n=1 Tax=Symbiodinium natans TaxID=878477 RepID=A0A812IAJ5_9DINO|nr:Toe1 [Symbiodinium natans]